MAAFDAESISMPEAIRQLRFVSPAAEREAQVHAGPEHPPSADELAHAMDISPDPTIPNKVAAVRASGEPDLLTNSAPRE